LLGVYNALTLRYTAAGVVAVGGPVEIVRVASTAGVSERLTETRPVVEVPALNLFTTGACIDLQVTSLDAV